MNCQKNIYWVFHEGGPYHTETSLLIPRANQWTGFYMIETFLMKVLKCLSSWVTMLRHVQRFQSTHNSLWYRGLLRRLTMQCFTKIKSKLSQFEVDLVMEAQINIFSTKLTSGILHHTFITLEEFLSFRLNKSNREPNSKFHW